MKIGEVIKKYRKKAGFTGFMRMKKEIPGIKHASRNGIQERF